jgi:hypothetical protein
VGSASFQLFKIFLLSNRDRFLYGRNDCRGDFVRVSV